MALKIESPIFDELIAEGQARAIKIVLCIRFGVVPADIAASLDAIEIPERLDALTEDAMRCPNMDRFRERVVLAILDSPAVLKLIAHTRQESIVSVLQTRFGEVPTDVKASLEGIERRDQLDSLTATAAVCPDLDAFCAKLSA